MKYWDVEITPELRATLQEIDAIKARIASRQAPPEAVLQQLEQEFIEGAVYHGMRLVEHARQTKNRA